MNHSERTLQMAAFTVGPHECALDIMEIREIVNPLPITRVPRAPDFLEGVVELRGAIVPIVDLRKRFDLPATADRPSAKYLIVSLDKRIIGLIVDGVTEVISVNRNEIRPAPNFYEDGETQPFLGMCRYKDRLILILNLKVLLTHKEKIKLSTIEVKDDS
jgi:purine-binding chemotaxis protein CheW